MSGSAVGSSTPCVMKWSVSHSLSRPSISASTSTHARPAAAWIRLTRLSGRKREYFASKAFTQVTAARSNAAACASLPVYCTSHTVPSARKDSFRNGAAAPAGTGGGGRWDWETTAMKIFDGSWVRRGDLPGNFPAERDDSGARVGALRCDTVGAAHVVLLERRIEIEAVGGFPDYFQAVVEGLHRGKPIIRRVVGREPRRQTQRWRNRGRVEVIVIKICGSLGVEPEAGPQDYLFADLLEPRDVDRMCGGAEGVVVVAVGRIDRAVQLGERAVETDEADPFFAVVGAILEEFKRQHDARENLSVLFDGPVRIGEVARSTAPGNVERNGRQRVEQLGDADDDIISVFAGAARLDEDLDLVVGAGEAGQQRGVLLVEIGERVDGPAVRHVVAFAAVADADGEVDAGKLAREIGIPRLAALGVQLGSGNLIAAGGRRQAGGRGAGDGVKHALQFEVHLRAEILLNDGPAGLDGNASAGFAIAFVFVAEGIFGARRARGEPDENARQQQRAAGPKGGGLHQTEDGAHRGSDSPEWSGQE